MDNALMRLSEAELIQLLYPVGAIYINFSEENPAVKFNGTWRLLRKVKIKKRGHAGKISIVKKAKLSRGVNTAYIWCRTA